MAITRKKVGQAASVKGRSGGEKIGCTGENRRRLGPREEKKVTG
jgi:hypothetical protein